MIRRARPTGPPNPGSTPAAPADAPLIPARRTRRHELVGAGPAHHPRIALHHEVAQAAAVEDPAIGLPVGLVLGIQPGGVPVQAVGVLHHELAGPEDPAFRPGLVPP